MFDFSIIAPVYKMKGNLGERFLVEYLCHLSYQTFKNFEVVIPDQSNDDSLKKICDICEEYKITHIYPSTNYFIDNLADNILASIFLHQNSKDINILCTGNIWTDKHFETILKSGLFGFRTNAIHSLKNFIRFKSNHSDKNGV